MGPEVATVRVMVQDKYRADGSRPFNEKIEVAAGQLMATIKSLTSDASVRRVIIRNAEGRQLVSFPLTVGIAGGAVALLMAPVLSAVAVLGGAAAKLKVEIIRNNGNPPTA